MAKKAPSRTKRWADACEKARSKFETVQSAADELVEALNDLYDIQQEFSDWRDNLPENLEQSALGEKLSAVVDEIDIESVKDEPLDNWGDVERAIDEAEGADLPLGFGRD